MNVKLTRFTKYLLDAMFIVGIFIALTLPVLLKWYGQFSDENIIEYLPQVVVVLEICGVFALLIIWELRKMFKTVLLEDCFVKSNVISLKRMGTFSFIIAMVMCIRCCLFYITLAAFAMVVVFIIAGLFSKVLAQVFDKAVAYKLENDFTI